MSQILPLFLAPIVLGIAGAFTPCALGVNAVFLGTVLGKSRARRLQEWAIFAGSRAALLTLLGLAFGLLGQAVQGFAWRFQVTVNTGMILLGALFIVHSLRPFPLPGFSLAGNRAPSPSLGVAGLGALFGLDITACIGPFVLALLARTVLVGNWWSGAVVLFLFGVSLSLPLLLAALTDRTAHWLVDVARRRRTLFFLAGGGFLIVLGIAELWLSAAGRYSV
ncbi:MAG: sulfite exporter TauE/SafE family protein [Chloroflexi bacterium]|nr:sulfite exporter TauE/SafE family protein [Chloroflexota bacterium]